MSDAPHLLVALSAGGLLGAAFYGGLWWTVGRGVSSSRPATWFLTSMLVRTAIAVMGFYFVSRGDLRRLLACLVGFVVARVVATRFAGAPRAMPAVADREGSP